MQHKFKLFSFYGFQVRNNYIKICNTGNAQSFSFNFQSFALYYLIVQKILFHVMLYGFN